MAAIAFGVIVVVDMVIFPILEAEAGCEKGLAVNKSLEKSKGKCFDQGTF